MADIQIPQRPVPNMQFQGAPADMINALYNRPKPGEIAAQSVGQGVAGLLDQYYKQKQLQAQAFGEGGPYLMNMLYGKGQQPAAGPQQPQVGGAVPSNGPGAPATSAQTLQPAPTQPGAGPLGQPFHPQDPNGLIQQSIAAGNPDHAGIYSGAQAGNPNLGVHAQKIQQLQGQMAQNAQMGAYGQKLNQGLQEQLGAEKALMEGEQFNVGQQKQQQQFNETQNAEESRFQRGEENKRKSVVAGAAEGQKETVSNIKLIDSAYGPLADALKQNKPSPLSDVRGNLTEKLGTAAPYGIPIGSRAANNVLNASNDMKAALSAEITRSGRFTPYVAEQLLNRLVPTAKDAEWQGKLQRIKSFRNALASGVNQNIDNAASAILSGSVGVSKMSDNSPGNQTSRVPASGPHGSTVKQNGHTYAWNAQAGQYE